MLREEREGLIRQYERGMEDVLAALRLVPREKRNWAPPGEWSATMVIHHLADTEAVRSVRLRRLLAEEAPSIESLDEPEYARRLHYDRPLETSLALFEACVRSNVELFRLLREADWKREGLHSELGPYSVEYLLQQSAAHGREHARQIARLAEPR